MKERPILFSAPMVRALLAGRKTQTRRIMKPQPTEDTESRWPGWKWPSAKCRSMVEIDKAACLGPYGAPGDTLWVKEAWRTSTAVDDKPGSILETPGNGYGWPVWCEADGVEHRHGGKAIGGPGFTDPGRYRNARFMPRWASRITLRVTSVRVERVQAITSDDAKAEGAPVDPSDPLCGRGSMAALSWYASEWDAINGKRAPWSANPWVWVVGFEVVK